MTKPYSIYESGDYLARNPTWDGEDSDWKARQVLRVFERNNLCPNTIVEVGCGAGGILASLHDALPGVSFSGFEIAPDASIFWERYKAKKISFMVRDFLSEVTTHFDVLLLLDVIEHLPNPYEFLSGIRGRAEYYVLHIPLDLSALSVARESPLLAVRRKVGHIHYFTKGLALSLLEECGYVILDWSYTGAALSGPRSTWKGRLAKLPRRLVFGLNRDLGVRLLGGDTLMVLARAN